MILFHCISGGAYEQHILFTVFQVRVHCFLPIDHVETNITGRHAIHGCSMSEMRFPIHAAPVPTKCSMFRP